MRKTLVLPFVIFLLSGCSNTQIEHLESAAFLKQAQKIKQMNSAHKTTYIGSTASRVYLEHYTVISSTGEGKTIVYWTERKNLSDRQLDAIENQP